METNNKDTLPKIITLDEIDYHLVESQVSEHDECIPNWWLFWYERHDSYSKLRHLPPQVTDGKEIYFLCSSNVDKEKAYNDMLEKVNSIDIEATMKIHVRQIEIENGVFSETKNNEMMGQENKDLLLKDLCERLPYGVKIAIHGSGKLTLRNVINSSIGWYIDAEGAPTDFSLDEAKPYLRPMSSMTEEEENEFRKIMPSDPSKGENWIDTFDWLLEHHFDYRNLIEKGLAIEAPENMYTVKNTGEFIKDWIPAQSCNVDWENEKERVKTRFVDRKGREICDGDIFIYLKYENFDADHIPEDLIENYSKYSKKVSLHPVFWDSDCDNWCSDVFGDCDKLFSYDFTQIVVVTNNIDHPELYNH